MIDHRSDIWSGSVTMMNVLVDKGAKWEPHDQVCTMYVASTLKTSGYIAIAILFHTSIHAKL